MPAYLAKRILYRVGSGLLVLGVLSGVGVWMRFGQPPDSFFDIPVYPGAQAVDTNGRKLHDPSRSVIWPQVVSFRASAPPATILDYYRDTLQHDGWQVVYWDSTPTKLEAFWGSSQGPQAVYNFEVRTEATSDPATAVTLTLHLVGR